MTATQHDRDAEERAMQEWLERNPPTRTLPCGVVPRYRGNHRPLPQMSWAEMKERP